MGIPQEEAYSDGFLDGQENILDEIRQIVEDSDGDFHERYVEIMEFVDDKKREIESL